MARSNLTVTIRVNTKPLERSLRIVKMCLLVGKLPLPDAVRRWLFRAVSWCLRPRVPFHIGKSKKTYKDLQVRFHLEAEPRQGGKTS